MATHPIYFDIQFVKKKKKKLFKGIWIDKLYWSKSSFGGFLLGSFFLDSWGGYLIHLAGDLIILLRVSHFPPAPTPMENQDSFWGLLAYFWGEEKRDTFLFGLTSKTGPPTQMPTLALWLGWQCSTRHCLGLTVQNSGLFGSSVLLRIQQNFGWETRGRVTGRTGNLMCSLS